METKGEFIRLDSGLSHIILSHLSFLLSATSRSCRYLSTLFSQNDPETCVEFVINKTTRSNYYTSARYDKQKPLSVSFLISFSFFFFTVVCVATLDDKTTKMRTRFWRTARKIRPMRARPCPRR